LRIKAYLDTQPISVTEKVDIKKIYLGDQLRQNTQNVTELADSIKKVGLLQPIILRVKNNSNFEVVSGCRRFTACKALGHKTITCVVIDANDKEAFEVSLIENIQRSSLEPLEKAQAFKKYVLESGWGGLTELASNIGRSHSYIIKHIMLLDLPQDIIDLVNSEQLDPSTAQELFPVKDTIKQSEIAKMVISKQLSSKDVRQIVHGIQELDADTTLIRYSQQNKHTRRTERSLNKAILVLRIAMSRIGELVEEYGDNWFVHECLMEEKNVIHNQIDILLKKKKRLIKMISNNKVSIDSPKLAVANNSHFLETKTNLDPHPN
jgi:ParB family transcriptional regulator, chromosome partitioning protein